MIGAIGLRGSGLRPSDRVAVLSKNRLKYLELELTPATLGTVAATPRLDA